MKEEMSADKLQGQLIATTVLIEAILQTQSAQTLKAVLAQYKTTAPEVLGSLLNTQGSELMLDAYRSQTENIEERLRKMLQGAIFRDSRAGTL